MTIFEKLVLRALGLLVYAALWQRATRTGTEWDDKAIALIKDIDEATK